MAEQAKLTIRDRQWTVSLAVTPYELSRGLGGIPQIPPQTGMLFDLGRLQIIQVTTVPMLFPLDIAFLSDTLVITEVYRNIQPGYLITSTLPARYFLEVNAGELESIDSGDRASVELVPPSGVMAAPDWMSAMVGLVGFVIMGAVLVSVARDFIKGAREPEKPKLLPSVAVMPKLPEEARGDILFVEYIHDMVRLGEKISDEEARRLWEAWKGRQPLRLPAVLPVEGSYSWMITDPETGEILIKEGYSTPDKAMASATAFALRRARYAGEHLVALRIYDRSPDIGSLEEGVIFKGRIMIPGGKIIAETLSQTGPKGRFVIGTDRIGSIVITRPDQPGKSVYLQFESDKEIVLDALKRSERGDLDRGWTVEVKNSEPRASIFWELWEGAKPEESKRGAWPMARPFKKPQEPQTARCPKCRKVWDLTTLRERKDYVPGKCPICKVPLRSIPQRGDEKTKVIPTAKPKRETPGELEYFADSPEFLTQTIDAIGYRDRIDSAFQEAIARARRAHDLTEQIADGSDTGKQKAA